jgi:hypothetical protein
VGSGGGLLDSFRYKNISTILGVLKNRLFALGDTGMKWEQTYVTRRRGKISWDLGKKISQFI